MGRARGFSEVQTSIEVSRPTSVHKFVPGTSANRRVLKILVSAGVWADEQLGVGVHVRVHLHLHRGERLLFSLFGGSQASF